MQDDDGVDIEPVFLEFKSGGAVHVMRKMEPFGVMHELHQRYPFGAGMCDWIMGRQVAYCGRRGGSGELHGISSFADDRLCFRCKKLWPHPPDLLFEHPTEEYEDA